jgi:hypothetical protein
VIYQVYCDGKPMSPWTCYGCDRKAYGKVMFRYKTLKRIINALRWVLWTGFGDWYRYEIREGDRVIAKVIPCKDKWDRYRVRFSRLTPGETSTIIKLIKTEAINVDSSMQGDRSRYGIRPN